MTPAVHGIRHVVTEFCKHLHGLGSLYDTDKLLLYGSAPREGLGLELGHISEACNFDYTLFRYQRLVPHIVRQDTYFREPQRFYLLRDRLISHLVI